MTLTRLRNRQGITIVELVVVAFLIGAVATVAIPRALKTSPRQELARATRQLARDLEQVRTQALAAKRSVRVRFDAAANFYTAYMDVSETRSGTISESTEEVRESRLIARDSHEGVPGVSLPGRVKFGAGVAARGPLGEGASDPILLEDDRVEFNARGMVVPLGTNGVVFLTHESDPSVVAAVTISGAGSFQAWHYRDGKWER